MQQCMQVTSVRNPRWVNEEQTAINVLARFSHLGDQEVPFTATDCDCEEHGRCIFEDLINGKYGPIADYVPPPPLTDEQITSIVLEERDRKLRESDWTQLGDVPEATKLLWQPYRQALRDITAQEGFPRNVVWPTPPS